MVGYQLDDFYQIFTMGKMVVNHQTSINQEEKPSTKKLFPRNFGKCGKVEPLDAAGCG